MKDALVIVSMFSIFIPGIIGIIRRKHYDRIFIPFLLFIWLGCINELLSAVLMAQDGHTTANNNIYVLLASLLIVLFFQRVQLFKKWPAFPWILMSIWILAWLAETFLLRTIHKISSYFRILFSLGTVLMSISYINILLFQSSNILKEGIFWICTGFIIHFTLKVLVEIFWMYGIKNQEFQLNVFNILLIANIITNLTYALAVLWNNRKTPYSLQW